MSRSTIDTREQSKEVNGYADSTIDKFESRKPLQCITIQLHNVSQLANSGLGSVPFSVKLNKKLVAAHASFCVQTRRGKPGTADQRTQTAFKYVSDSFKCRES